MSLRCEDHVLSVEVVVFVEQKVQIFQGLTKKERFHLIFFFELMESNKGNSKKVEYDLNFIFELQSSDILDIGIATGNLGARYRMQ